MKPCLKKTYSDAISARDNGVPYHKILDLFDLTPRQFWSGVQSIESLVTNVIGEQQAQLLHIATEKERKKKLFLMNPEYLEEKYADVQSGALPEFPRGTFLHPDNVNFLVYHALSVHTPLLNSSNRQEIIQAIKSLPYDLYKYLRRLKLRSALDLFNESPKKILEIIDNVYKERTKDNSLFDTQCEFHIHDWEKFKLPQNYWHDKKHIEDCIYHILTEIIIASSSANPSPNEILHAFEVTPLTTKYMGSIGLQRVMQHMYRGKTAPALDVMRVFDEVYQNKTRNPSLFDPSQPAHISISNQNTLSVVHNL